MLFCKIYTKPNKGIMAGKRRKTKETPPNRREHSNALKAFEMYREMGPTRNWDGLMRLFADMEHPPAKALKTVRSWALYFNWEQRLKEWDEAHFVENLRKQRETQERETMERLRKFRQAADQAAVNSLVVSAQSLDRIRGLAEQIMARVEVKEKTQIRDVTSIASAIEMLTRNIDKAIDIKAKIEGIDVLLERLERLEMDA